MIPVEKLRHFRFNGLGKQLLRSFPKHFGQGVPDFARDPWILECDYLIVLPSLRARESEARARSPR